MEALLVRKGLYEVASGGTPEPTTGSNSVTMRAWQKKNSEAHAELILHVEIDQLPHMTSRIAFEIWTELEKVHRA